MGQLVLHLLLGLVDLHPPDGLKLILLPIQLSSQLPPDSCVVQCPHLVLFVLTFQGIIQLLNVLIETVGVRLHLLDDKLKLFVLPLALVDLPLQLFLSPSPLSLFLPQLFLKLIVFSPILFP
jgi:hypothetical protein